MKKEFTIEPTKAFEAYYLDTWEEEPNYNDISTVVKKTVYEAGYLDGVKEAMKQLRKNGSL